MTEQDIPAVIALGRQMHAESDNYRMMSFSAERVEAVCKAVTRDGFAVVAVNRLGEIIGMMAGCLVQPVFSEEFMACDYLLYVRLDDRGGLTAGRLVDAYIDWATSKGVRVITVGVTAGCADAEATEFYQSWGFRPCGSQFRMEV